MSAAPAATPEVRLMPPVPPVVYGLWVASDTRRDAPPPGWWEGFASKYGPVAYFRMEDATARAEELREAGYGIEVIPITVAPEQ